MVGMFVSLCLASKKSSEREFFVPAGTLILGVKLLKSVTRFCVPFWTDDRYADHADKIKCLKNVVNLREKRAIQGRVRMRHNTLNGRPKNWRILSQVFCHHISLHSNVFRACMVLTHLTIKNGKPLFEVEYECVPTQERG